MALRHRRQMRRVLTAGLVTALVGGLLWFVVGSLARKRTPQNLLIILVDALRADHLGCYGYKRDTSPFTDDLAASSVLFENVTSQASQTKLSVASLFTSMRPSTHKVRKVDHYVRETRDRILSSVLSPKFKTLAEVFSEAGFATGAWVTNPHLRDFLGFSQGFDEYYYADSIDGGKLIERFLLWVDQVRPRRFFAYIHLMDVHHPYRPPAPFNRRFVRRGGRVVYQNGFIQYVSPQDLSYTISQYDGEIRYVDATIKRLAARLGERGLLRQTLLVITADHGDEFFEHHGMGHGFTVYQEVLQVPLIMHWSAGLKPRRVAVGVRLIDLYPTLLDIFHLRRPYRLQGRSLVPVINGAGSLPEIPIYSESSNNIRSLRVGNHKLIEGFGLSGERVRVYELERDPIELRPLTKGKLIAELKQELARLAVADEARAREFGVGEKAELDDDTVRALRSLGYVN